LISSMETLNGTGSTKSSTGRQKGHEASFMKTYKTNLTCALEWAETNVSSRKIKKDI